MRIRWWSKERKRKREREKRERDRQRHQLLISTSLLTLPDAHTIPTFESSENRSSPTLRRTLKIYEISESLDLAKMSGHLLLPASKLQSPTGDCNC